MAQLKLIDEQKANAFGLARGDTDTQTLESELTGAGWTHADALKHIDAAIRAGAYAYAETTDKPANELPARVVIEASDGINADEASDAAKVLRKRQTEK